MIDTLVRFFKYIWKSICGCFRHLVCNSSCVDKCSCHCDNDEEEVKN